MIGALSGDIAGSVYEWHPVKTKDFHLFSDDCFFTDDSVLTVALADSIMNSTDYGKNMRRFYHLYPDAGYGNSFCRWAESEAPKPYNSWGNGAAMRISPVGYAFDDIDTVLAKAAEFTVITHNHPEGVKGAQVTAASVFFARTGKSKDFIRKFAETEFGYDLSRHVDEIRPDYSFDVSAQGTVPQAIRAFIDSENFEDAIKTAISLGGDADTLACITGGIAQAFYGVPAWIEAEVYNRLDERLGKITKKFIKKFCKPVAA